MTERSENIVGMRKKIKAQAEHIRRLEQRIRELKQAEQQPIGWITEDYLTDKSATTYSPEVADRWRTKGWPVSEIYAALSSPLDRNSL